MHARKTAIDSVKEWSGKLVPTFVCHFSQEIKLSTWRLFDLTPKFLGLEDLFSTYSIVQYTVIYCNIL